MLLSRIIADQQDCGRGGDIAHRRGRSRFSCQGRREGREVGGPVMVDVVGTQGQPGKLLQQIALLVAGAIGPDDADRIAGLFELRRYELNCLIPRRRHELAAALDQGTAEAARVIREVESVTSLDAEEVAVDAALVAIVTAHDVHAGIGTPYAQRRLAAVTAVRADCSDVLHLPRTGLVPVSTRGKCADGADVDAHAAFFALKMIFFIRRNDRAGTTVL